MSKKYFVLFAVFVIGLSGCRAIEPSSLVNEGFVPEVDGDGITYTFEDIKDDENGVILSYWDYEAQQDAGIILIYAADNIGYSYAMSNLGEGACEINEVTKDGYANCTEDYNLIKKKIVDAGYKSELSIVTKVYEAGSGLELD